MQVDILKKRRNSNLKFISVLIIITIGSIIITDYDVLKGFTGIYTAIKWGGSNFYPDIRSLRILPDILSKMKDTVLMSIAATMVASVFALFFASLGFLTRAFMETIDEVENNSIEALQAVGGNYLHIVFQAVLPASIPQMISWLLFMIETNIRDATLVGVLTGTGIGFSFELYYKNFDYHAASLVVMLIVITVIFIEVVSNLIRRVIL